MLFFAGRGALGPRSGDASFALLFSLYSGGFAGLTDWERGCRTSYVYSSLGLVCCGVWSYAIDIKGIDAPEPRLLAGGCALTFHGAPMVGAGDGRDEQAAVSSNKLKVQPLDLGLEVKASSAQGRRRLPFFYARPSDEGEEGFLPPADGWSDRQHGSEEAPPGHCSKYSKGYCSLPNTSASVHSRRRLKVEINLQADVSRVGNPSLNHVDHYHIGTCSVRSGTTNSDLSFRSETPD
jgi:hypothetical protein